MYIQQIPWSATNATSQQNAKPSHYLPLITIGCGLVLVAIAAAIVLYRRQRDKTQLAQSRDLPIDRYEAEFLVDSAPSLTDNPTTAPNPSTLAFPSEEPTNDSESHEEPQEKSPAIDWYEAEFLLGPPPTPTPKIDPLISTPSVAERTDRREHCPEPKEEMPSQNSENLSLSDRYFTFIQQIVADTLKGKIGSKEYVYTQLVAQLEPEPGMGEIFERCLIEQMTLARDKVKAAPSEVKQAKAQRQVRALSTLEEAWNRYQETQRTQNACSDAVAQLLDAGESDRLFVLLQILDPNQTHTFSSKEIESLAQELEQIRESDGDRSTVAELHALATGLEQGLSIYTSLDLLGWLYEKPQLGFESKAGANNSWAYWAKQISSPLPKMFFSEQSNNRSAVSLAREQTRLDLSAWVELIVLLRGIQEGLVGWFDKQPYNIKAGNDAAASTFLTFAIIWSELSNGFRQAERLLESDRDRIANACFQIALQILRTFAQRDNFPIYGGVFASFTGKGFRDTIAYLDRPLKTIEKKQEKARILTVLGYSQQWTNNRDRALLLHEEALKLARQESDRKCEVANLNHLSRLKLSLGELAEAIDLGQRALLFARQMGDPLGEINAIANLGYAEVRRAQQQEHIALSEIEACIERLKRGMMLLEKHKDFLSEVFCLLSMGIAHLILEQSNNAKSYLEKSLTISIQLGNLELEGVSHATLGEVNYQLGQLPSAVFHACLGLYLLEQKNATGQRQIANLVTILKGKLGEEAFEQALQQQRSQIIARIGLDGFDEILK
ncbi:MAG: tetratricopeptide repeat protein [Cyanobacteria bacterium SBLK]|nr:tetratricopeptide repeat protein [Cyanobacteria bacterium SBLK]